MAKALSVDLRERIIKSIGEGKSRRAVAGQFGVAPSTAVRLQARFEATGSGTFSARPPTGERQAWGAQGLHHQAG